MEYPFQVTYIGKHGLTVQSDNPKKEAFLWTLWAATAHTRVLGNPKPDGIERQASIGRVYNSDGSVTAYAEGLGGITFDKVKDTEGYPAEFRS
jgi:hypothetical protein